MREVGQTPLEGWLKLPQNDADLGPGNSGSVRARRSEGQKEKLIGIKRKLVNRHLPEGAGRKRKVILNNVKKRGLQAIQNSIV